MAQAVVTSFGKTVLPADTFKMYAGRGVEGKVNGLKLLPATKNYLQLMALLLPGKLQPLRSNTPKADAV